jgi:hypothetical protein
LTGVLGGSVFALVAALAITLELAAQRRRHRHVSLVEVFRWLRRHALMRWALLVSWGFVGWHLFVQ